ncbi:fatty acid desaturase family protein [Oceanibacterium hippocampi]|uniref:Fatty acid desaturase n=1 Tax=Oceanibacterium hippocampi TaxID=745714 RepID=A0A1Y5SDD7_9PROT|nr:fatty acid desaturase family protein [Oceanibacterium hippocampi]SLN37101.1 Fatty acid desaturase [Oceanibacterium hippocampi]
MDKAGRHDAGDPALGSLAGEEFRAGRGGALAGAELKALNRLDDRQALLSVAVDVAMIAVTAWVALRWWSAWTVLPAMLVMASRQHALVIIAHEAVHYRLFSGRLANEIVGRLAGYAVGISMCTYRVVHRLHHNHLYGPSDPDMPLMAGYPRGRLYLVRKLAKDLCGLGAWRNFAYFFGAPGLNRETGAAARPLIDTSERLGRQALADRWAMLAVQAGLLGLALSGGWWREYLLLWVVPLLTIFQVLLRLRAVLEHGAPANPAEVRQAARTNHCPGPLRWLLFPHAVNYHLEHHLYPAIPHYNLPKAHALLAARGFLDDAEVRPVGATLRRIFADPVPDPNPDPESPPGPASGQTA